ncbi:hypothetical protein NQ317_004795 [Molorchus minor]|uniref:C2H2-type domain-containing protein n=1 Tax=Molorchus minor TaxID=1323400 RepID=A0ABQ9JR91_9CUCU|nr:hypothetical protein NQ317_004795 [Molorchus minor]
MRHLEKQLESTMPALNQNQGLFESLSEFAEIKEEIPSFVLDDNFTKNEFISDEDSLIATNLVIDVKNDSDSCEDQDSCSKNEVRKNRRKASNPHRAIQLETSECGSVENSSESSQDNSDNLKFTNIPNLDVSLSLDNGTGLLKMIFTDDDLGEDICQECPKGFSLQSMLHVHVLAKHTKAKPFTCEECGKSFVTKPGLKIHLKKHKTEIKEDYPCVECGKVLHTRGGLTSHMNVHRLGRRFMCDVCGKTFTQKVNMQQHVKQHTGDKPHSCDKCGKTFAEKSHLARHYSFHSEERPFKCDVCQKMYKTERCLKVHSLVHAAARPFVCGYCSKGFLSSTRLKQHYNIHTGERPYKCKYCERTFTNYPNWLKHTRRRHKVDHKTGAVLEPKTTKEEVSPAPTPSSEQTTVQGLLNFPLLDDKAIFNQQLDFLTGKSSNNSMGFLVPYFQTALPGHQTIIQHTTQTALPIQINDLVHVNYTQQTLPCD